jgi:hypothetical protein
VDVKGLNGLPDILTYFFDILAVIFMNPGSGIHHPQNSYAKARYLILSLHDGDFPFCTLLSFLCNHDTKIPQQATRFHHTTEFRK